MRIHPASPSFSTSFGEHLLALRDKTGLSQTQLARAAGIRHQTLARWEQGTAFPQRATLQRLIAALTQRRAFTPGLEIEEAIALWEHANAESSRRFPLFDRTWFVTLLADLPAVANPPLFDWGDAAITPRLQGRDAELAQLRHWLLEGRAHVVGVFGAGGIGKSSLASRFASGAVPHFEVIIVRSLRQAPPLHETLQSILRLCGLPGSRDTNTRAQLAALQTLLRERRGLLIFDDLETILEAGEKLGEYRPGYADYGELIRLFAESSHRWCLLLTSRERPRQFWLLEQQGAAVRSLVIQGLSPQACQALLAPLGITGEPEDWDRFARHYRGNPLAVSLAAAIIRDRYAGQLAAALSGAAAIFHEISDLLLAQIARTSAPEYMLLLWLTIEREPVSVQQIIHDVAGAISETRILQALETLLQRALIEHVNNQETFALQPMAQAVLIEQFVAQVVRELQDGRLELICRYALLQGTAKEYLRQSQLRLIVEPCLARLRAHYGSSAAVVAALTACLDTLRRVPLAQQRYGGSNLAHLIAHERGDLRAVDLSGLLFLGTNFAGVAMQQADLRGAQLRQARFTEQFARPDSLAVSPNGGYLAVATADGVVQLWRTTDFVQVARFPAHRRRIGQIQFRADSAALATASQDGTLGIWAIPAGQLLQRLVLPGSELGAVAWARDGATLFSGGADGRIQRWSLAAANVTATIEPLERGATIAVSPDGRSIACGYGNGIISVWDVESLTLRWVFKGHAGAVLALAWHPNSQLLATGGADPYIHIWDAGQQQQVDMVDAAPAASFGLAWSSDGRLLAGTSGDGRVRIWQRTSGRCILTLDGDPAGACGVAFFPDCSALASGGADQTVRVWEIATGERRATLTGWSPDGQRLASGSDQGWIVGWGGATNRELRRVRNQRPYAGMRIAGIHGITTIQHAMLLALGADDTT